MFPCFAWARCGPSVACFGHVSFAFSGFEAAVSAPCLRRNCIPLKHESCWCFPVSHACPTETIVAVPKMLFQDHLFACRGTALGLNPAGDPVFRNHARPCLTRHFVGLLAFYVFCALCCLVCLLALHLAVPKMLFRDHLFACLGTALGLNPAGDPVFRNHAPPCSTGLLHGPSSLLCLLWLVLPCLPCSLDYSSSEDAISRPKKPLAVAPPWAWILLGIRCFGTMPDRALQGISWAF